jgi:hypothetical protein
MKEVVLSTPHFLSDQLNPIGAIDSENRYLI